jgi:hypothetical protein
LTASIRKSFSQPPKRLVQGIKETTEHPGSDNRVLWIIGRSYLRQKVFELAEGLTDSKRKSALALLVRKWCPYESAGFAAHWVGRQAAVYAWDAAKVESAIVDAGLSPRFCTVLPETFIRTPHADGARLATMTDGYEGQFWRQGLLAATRWWPERPNLREWIAFLRGAGADLSEAGTDLPEPAETPLLNTPWTAPSSAPITDLWSLLQNDRAAAVAATLLAVPFIYLLAEAGILGVAGMRLNAMLSSLSQANQSIRLDRSAALANLDTIQKYLSLEPFPPQIQIVQAVQKVLGAQQQKLSITDWTFDAGNLEILLHGDTALDATFFIEAFEKDPLFSNVRATTENQENDLRIRIQVNPKSAPPS